MGLWPFGRKRADEMDVQNLLDRANIASPTGPAPAATAAGVADGAFRMTVEDIFTITGRGTVVTGRIESGTVRVGMQLDVVRAGAVAATTLVTGIEMFRKIRDTATVGDNVGLLLSGLTGQELQQGDVLQG